MPLLGGYHRPPYPLGPLGTVTSRGVDCAQAAFAAITGEPDETPTDEQTPQRKQIPPQRIPHQSNKRNSHARGLSPVNCFHPWKPPAALGLPPTTTLICGQCAACRLRRSSEWATRCMHEAKQHPHNIWVTLTYDDDHLPDKYDTGALNPNTHKKIFSGSLRKTHMQQFYRRLRKALHKPNAILHNGTVRYYYAGEYGEKYHRPHYHACLFGIDLTDKKHITKSHLGFDLYESATLKELWPHGHHRISELTWETAAYTARYIMKKITGQQQQQHYQVINKQTGEIINREPEFNEMSRKPGIGNSWYEKYKKSVYMEKRTGVRVRGRLTAPPRYYDKLLQKQDAAKYLRVKQQRFMDNLKNTKNHTPARLKAEEIITQQKIKTLKQKL